MNIIRDLCYALSGISDAIGNASDLDAINAECAIRDIDNAIKHLTEARTALAKAHVDLLAKELRDLERPPIAVEPFNARAEIRAMFGFKS